jgi:YVTN family beta-propeller protein
MRRQRDIQSSIRPIQARRARPARPAPLAAAGLRASRALVAIGAIAIAALFAAGVYLALGKLRLSAADDHAHADLQLVRTVAGPLDAAAGGARARLEVMLNLDASDPRARWPLAPGIPAGDKVQLTVALSDQQTGAPLAGLAPIVELYEDHPAPSAPSAAPGEDPFEVRETYTMVGQSGDLSLVNAGGHNHTPGAQLGASAGSSSLAALKLPGPVADAIVDRASRFLFAALPLQNQVAVVDTLTRKLSRTIAVGKLPDTVAAEPSGQRIWVANDGDGSLTAIDTATYAARTVAVGAGHHDIAFSTDSRLAFVANGEAGTVMAIDTSAGRVIAEAPVGSAPHGLDYANGRLYVASAGAGAVCVLAVEGARLAPLATIPTGAGASQVRIDPTGAYGVVSNTAAGSITVFDTSSSRPIKTIKADPQPGDIVFMGGYALVRSHISPNVTFVLLAKPDISDIITFGSQSPVFKPGPHARLSLGANGDEVLVPDADAGKLYTIHIMNGQPMAMDQTTVSKGTDQVLSLINKVRELVPGTYQRTLRFDRAGSYTLHVRPGPGRAPLEFKLDVVPSKSLKPWIITALAPAERYVAGREAELRFRLTGRQSGVADDTVGGGVITVLRFAAGERPWQQTVPAENIGDGIYRARLTFPSAGSYAATYSSSEAGLAPEDSPPMSLDVSGK